jgi:hypothetical protein
MILYRRLIQIAAVAKKEILFQRQQICSDCSSTPPKKKKYKHYSYSVPNSISNCIAAEGTDKKEEA